MPLVVGRRRSAGGVAELCNQVDCYRKDHRTKHVGQQRLAYTEVCPEYIKITDNAIIPMKERVADKRYDPLGLLMPRWRNRSGKDQ